MPITSLTGTSNTLAKLVAVQDAENDEAIVRLPSIGSHPQDSEAEPLIPLFERPSFPVKATLVVLPKSLLKQWQRTIETQVKYLLPSKTTASEQRALKWRVLTIDFSWLSGNEGECGAYFHELVAWLCLGQLWQDLQ